MGGENNSGWQYEDPNKCFSEKHTTPFGLEYDMDQMKDMVRNADPGTVERVAQGWAALSKELVGGGGIKETFEAAVEHVMAHWEGASADLFAQRARVISKKITDSAKYAENTSQSLKGAAAVLANVKREVLAMKKPSRLSSAGDFIGDLGDRDASGADNALRNGSGSQDALDSNDGSLSAGREAQLKMAAQMEILGAAYNSRAKEMGSWKPGPVDESHDYPGDPGGIPPAAVVVPTGNAPRSPQGATAGTPRGGQTGLISPSKPVSPPAGITGGAHKPVPALPQVGTAIDGVSGGNPGSPNVGGSTVGSGSTGPGGGVTSGAGLVGTPAAGPGAGRGAMASRSGVSGGPGAGAVRGGASAGAVGRPGAGGLGGSVGAGAARGGARAGGVAHQGGGVVGGTPRAGAGAGAGAAAGRGTAGGSGLHRSRGATGTGAGAGAARKGGMVGVPGARTGRPKDQEEREGERPDYLVEDEETWTPRTNAAPRVIE